MRYCGKTSLISIRKSADELDRLSALHSAAAECYELALRSTSQYTVEVDPQDLLALRKHLDAIGQEWRNADSPGGMRTVQASFRGELRDYRDRTQERLSRLRGEMEAVVKAMASLANTIATNGADHQDRLQVELKQLGRLGENGSLEEMRSGIRLATKEIAASVELIQRGNQMVIAQLQDEIRTLHQEFQSERRALFTDPVSGAWNRQKLDERIDALLRQKQPFCLLLVQVRNLKRLEQQHSRTVVEGALKALIRRFHGVLGTEALIGRWSGEEFAALMDPQSGGSAALAREVAGKLSGSYAIQENGLSKQAVLDVAVGIIDPSSAAEPAPFLKRLETLSATLKL
jgi:GGDEF domain-containing protein